MTTQIGNNYTGQVGRQQQVAGGIITSAQYQTDHCNCDWHYHKNLHLTFVFQGTGTSESRASGNVKPAESVYLYRAGERHRWIPATPLCTSINVELEETFHQQFDLSDGEVGRALETNRDVKFLLLKMQRELMLADPDSPASMTTLLLDLASQPQKASRLPPDWLNIATEYLHDHWSEPVSLTALSLAADVHPVTLSKSFRRHFHCTLGEYARKLKIEHSLSLVKDSKMSLTQVALQCGFADQSHFLRTFKQITGFRPGRYRRL